jgi:hypothetical protein
MPTEETFHQAMQRLDRAAERDRKISDRLFIGLLGIIFLGLALSFYLLHLQIQQTHVA